MRSCRDEGLWAGSGHQCPRKGCTYQKLSKTSQKNRPCKLMKTKERRLLCWASQNGDFLEKSAAGSPPVIRFEINLAFLGSSSTIPGDLRRCAIESGLSGERVSITMNERLKSLRLLHQVMMISFGAVLIFALTPDLSKQYQAALDEISALRQISLND